MWALPALPQGRTSTTASRRTGSSSTRSARNSFPASRLAALSAAHSSRERVSSSVVWKLPRLFDWGIIELGTPAASPNPPRSRVGSDVAEAAAASPKVGDRCGEILRTEFWPGPRREAQLGVGAFPEQEITEPLLATRAHDEI